MQTGLIHVPPRPGLATLSAVAPLPQALPAINYHKAVSSWPILLNTTKGTCVPAGCLHQIQLRMANAWGSSWAPTDEMATSLYSLWNPSDASMMLGCDVPTAMNYWASSGINTELQSGLDVVWHVGSQKDDLNELGIGVEWCGCAGLSLALPNTIQSQMGATWTVGTGKDAAPGSYGNHYVMSGRYDSSGLWCITWGQEQHMDWDFYQRYALRTDFTFSASWLEASGVTPGGFTREQVVGILNRLT